jgi:GntR family transcriptional regulator
VAVTDDGTASVLQRVRALALDLTEGQRLPPERALAEDLGVARMTVRRAIATLAREGLVRSVQGSGNVRAHDALPLRVSLGSFATAVEAQGMVPSTRLLERVADADPPAAVARFLRLRRDARTMRIRRLRLGDGVPLALEQTWLPWSQVRDLDDELATGSLYEYLGSRRLLPDSGEESVRADLPTEDETRVLAVPSSRPVLRLVRRAAVAGQPIEYAEAVLPADWYELSFPLAPRSTAPPRE